jgi:glutaryl-CoA dehydrogenase
MFFFINFNFNGETKQKKLPLQSVTTKAMDNARAYSQSKLTPRIRKAFNEESFDRNIYREMGELGFVGCTISEYGLPGVSSAAYGNNIS